MGKSSRGNFKTSQYSGCGMGTFGYISWIKIENHEEIAHVNDFKRFEYDQKKVIL